jgi:hypothetical protein
MGSMCGWQKRQMVIISAIAELNWPRTMNYAS